MAGIVQSLDDKLTGIYQKGTFNKQDFLAVLQGVVGFFTAIKDGNPSDFIDNALDMASGPLAGKQCLKSLDQYKNSIKKWLTFGEHYKPYEDSSQLDFDQLDVGSIPEIMQVWILCPVLTLEPAKSQGGGKMGSLYRSSFPHILLFLS